MGGSKTRKSREARKRGKLGKVRVLVYFIVEILKLGKEKKNSEILKHGKNAFRVLEKALSKTRKLPNFSFRVYRKTKTREIFFFEEFNQELA